MAPYRPKSLDELNQAYDKVKAERQATKPAPVPPQPTVPRPADPQVSKPAAEPPAHSIADTVRARENKQAISGAVDDFIKQFSAQEAAPQSAYAWAQETAQKQQAQAKQEIEQETQRAFDDVLSFPDFSTTPPEPPAYRRYTHEEAPIKEGDLSGLMDEYIAVMTDQNGEEENRRSFLRRRKDRKKNKQPQHAEPEASVDLFDLSESDSASRPAEKPPVAPEPLPFDAPAAPEPLPFDAPAAPEPLPFDAPVAPEPLPFDAPVAPEPLPFDVPVAPEPLPFEEPAVPEELPIEEPAAPEELPIEEPAAPEELPFEEPAVPEELPFEEPAVPVELPFEEPAAPEELPIEESAAPKMPEYTPYQSPVPQPDYDMPQPVRTEAKPKRKINMEPEPVFDPHRLFADLDDDPETVPTVETPAAPERLPFDEPTVPTEPLFDNAAAPKMPAAEAAEAMPQQFEDVTSYSDETQADRFAPAPEEAPAAQTPDETVAPTPEASADEDDYDLAALNLQQEVVIRPSKLKVFFKLLVGLLILISLLATAAVGMIKLVLNVNTGKSAFGDYYFFAVSNEYANVDIHSGDLILAKRKVPLDSGDTAVYVDPDTRSFSFGRNDASSPDPEIYNKLVYNLSGIAVREDNVLGVVAKIVPKGGTVVRTVLGDFYIYLGICLGVFFFLLLIRVIFLRKKRRYLTVDELAQSQEAKENAKKQKSAKTKKAKKEKEQPASAAPAATAFPEENDLFSDID